MNMKDNNNPFSIKTSQEKTKIKKYLKSNQTKQIIKDDIEQYSKLKKSNYSKTIEPNKNEEQKGKEINIKVDLKSVENEKMMDEFENSIANQNEHVKQVNKKFILSKKPKPIKTGISTNYSELEPVKSLIESLFNDFKKITEERDKKLIESLFNDFKKVTEERDKKLIESLFNDFKKVNEERDKKLIERLEERDSKLVEALGEKMKGVLKELKNEKNENKQLNESIKLSIQNKENKEINNNTIKNAEETKEKNGNNYFNTNLSIIKVEANNEIINNHNSENNMSNTNNIIESNNSNNNIENNSSNNNNFDEGRKKHIFKVIKDEIVNCLEEINLEKSKFSKSSKSVVNDSGKNKCDNCLEISVSKSSKSEMKK